jgi:hypothetical protein
MNTVLITRSAEDVSDVLGVVGEVIPGIALPVDSIENAASVRVDQTAKKPVWMYGHDLLLPRSELNTPFVFPSWPMLRKDAGPVLPVRVYLDTAHVLNGSRGATKPSDHPDRAPAFFNDPEVSGVQDDPQSEHSSRHG